MLCCFGLFLAHERVKWRKQLRFRVVQHGLNSIHYPSEQRKWRLWFIHKSSFFCQRALDKGRSTNGNNSAEKSKEQTKPKTPTCSLLHQVVQVDWAVMLNSMDDMKNLSQHSCCASVLLLVRFLHLFQCSSFSFIASSQLLVRYNSTLFKPHSLHQAAVRLHQRVKVTAPSCFAGLLQRHSPSHRPSESHLASAAVTTICLGCHYRNVEKSLLQYWPALMKGRWLFDSHYWQICVDIYFAVTFTYRFYRNQCAACYTRLYFITLDQ